MQDLRASAQAAAHFHETLSFEDPERLTYNAL